MKTDTAELNKRFRFDSSYFQYPKYLSRAAELLGESHYMYRNLQAKQYYFEGVLIRLQRDKLLISGSILTNPTLMKLTEEDLQLQEKALNYEDKAAFIYHEIAMLNHNMANMEEAYENYQKSVSISPNWGLSLTQLGYVCAQTGRHEEAGPPRGRRAGSANIPACSGG